MNGTETIKYLYEHGHIPSSEHYKTICDELASVTTYKANPVADAVMKAITKTTGEIWPPPTDYQRGLCQMALVILQTIAPFLKAERDVFAERIRDNARDKGAEQLKSNAKERE